MRFRIDHSTIFTYDQLISEAYSEMRLKPLDGDGQRCLAFSLITEPRDEVLQYTDRFGNDVRHFDVLQPHQQLRVTATSEVLTSQSFAPDHLRLSQLDEFDFLDATHYAPLSTPLL